MRGFSCLTHVYMTKLKKLGHGRTFQLNLSGDAGKKKKSYMTPIFYEKKHFSQSLELQTKTFFSQV